MPDRPLPTHLWDRPINKPVLSGWGIFRCIFNNFRCAKKRLPPRICRLTKLGVVDLKKGRSQLNVSARVAIICRVYARRLWLRDSSKFGQGEIKEDSRFKARSTTLVDRWFFVRAWKRSMGLLLVLQSKSDDDNTFMGDNCDGIYMLCISWATKRDRKLFQLGGGLVEGIRGEAKATLCEPNPFFWGPHVSRCSHTLKYWMAKSWWRHHHNNNNYFIEEE